LLTYVTSFSLLLSIAGSFLSLICLVFHISFDEHVCINFLNSWLLYVLILFIVLVNLEEPRQLHTKTDITRKWVNWSVG
jgi:hypothetical protein